MQVFIQVCIAQWMIILLSLDGNRKQHPVFFFYAGSPEPVFLLYVISCKLLT